MKWFIYLWCVCIDLIFAILFSVLYHTVFSRQPHEISSVVSEGNPFVFVRDEEYCSGIDDVLVSDSCVYILYGDLHLVKVYNVEGNYKCTIAISDKESHGQRAQIYTKENKLFLICSNDVYEFENNVYRQFYGFAEDTTLIKLLHKNRDQYRNNTDRDQWEYYIRGVSIFRKNTLGQKEIFLRRPLWTIVGTFIFSWSLWLMFFGLLFFPLLLKKLKN